MEATRILILESWRRNILTTKLSLFLELQIYIRNKSKLWSWNSYVSSLSIRKGQRLEKDPKTSFLILFISPRIINTSKNTWKCIFLCVIREEKGVTDLHTPNNFSCNLNIIFYSMFYVEILGSYCSYHARQDVN